MNNISPFTRASSSSRNLLYTGIIRGKSLVVLVGEKRAVGMAVRGVKDRRRWSKLRERLSGQGDANSHH